MKPVSPARRRAEEFQRLIEAPPADAGSARAPELAELAVLATDMSQLPPVQPSASFSADLRERLMTAAATELAPAGDTAGEHSDDRVADRLTVGALGTPATRRRHQRRATVLLGTLAVIGGATGTAVASQSAVPGDVLYPVKRTIERVDTSLADGDHARGLNLLERASTRLGEAHTLTSAGNAEAAQVTDALESFVEEAGEGADLLTGAYQLTGERESISALLAFTDRSLDTLTDVEQDVPADAREAMVRATRTVLEIDADATALCGDCGASIDEVPGVLLLASEPTPPATAPATPAPPSPTRAETAEPTPGATTKAHRPDLPDDIPTDIPGTAPEPEPEPTPPGPTGATPSPDGDEPTAGTSRTSSPDSDQDSDGDGGRVLTGEDGALTGEDGLLPAEDTGPIGTTVDGVVGGVEDLVGGLLSGLTGAD